VSPSLGGAYLVVRACVADGIDVVYDEAAIGDS